MSALTLEEEIAEAIRKDGGLVSLSQLPVREGWLRKRLGDKKLLNVLKGREDLFEIIGSGASMAVKVQNQALSTHSSIDIHNADQAASELLDWVQHLLDMKQQAIKLPHIVADKRIKKRLHQFTRAVGCDHPAFSTQWWDDACEKLIELVKASGERFLLQQETPDDIRSVTIDLREGCRSSHKTDADFVSSMNTSTFINRLSYQLRQSGRVARRNEKQHFSLQLSKLGSDDQIQRILKGRSLSSIIQILSDNGTLTASGISIESAVTKKGNLTLLSLQCAEVKKASEDIDQVSIVSDVLFESLPLFIVVHKPTGVTTEQVADFYWNSGKYRDSKSTGVDTVSRLDRGTSGALALPLSTDGEKLLGDHFRESRINKTYICLVSGETPESGSIELKLHLVDNGSTYKSYVSPHGKDSLTTYRRLEVLRRQGAVYSLVEVHPKTGRTHQIRAHMSSVGHPLVRDGKYGGEKRSKRHSKWCGRLFLHAASIEIPSYEPVEAPLADDLQKVINYLKEETPSIEDKTVSGKR
eukprot:TRINITY_DN21635_c0_g1_i1.p1 TRINITY_DN21635_c0_g1~~TRINITY_DN21635_c0_g1_i1.p1  ORF type:complete len:526 (+),score=102.06 TRINITY_DN21635_c0_g1_i1:138-1715(+)